MDVNYELYKVFYYVASTLSFSEAASQLFISQSAVSQSIKTLEKKLNQTLFIRSTKKVQLTPEGEILLRHIEPAVHLISRGETQLMDTSAGGGQLRIGASDTICRYFLVPYLEKFHKAFPGAHIKVTNATSIKCVELLESGQVDLIVVNCPNAYLGNLSSVKIIKSFHDVFIANQSFKDLKGKKVVINVFPSLDTAVCAASVRRFNKEAASLPNTVVLAVSKDLPFAQGRFCTTEGIDKVIPLSAFRCSCFENGYGMLMVDGPLKGLLARGVIVVDEAGKVVYEELVSEITNEPNYEAAIASLKN